MASDMLLENKTFSNSRQPKWLVVVVGSLLLTLASVLPAAERPNVVGGEAVAIFDGKTLQGWEADPQRWRVEGGAIVGEIAPGQSMAKNNWIIWRGGELKDFELNLKFKISGASAANSGIQIRAQATDTQHVAGYQADLDMGATWLGRLYDEHGRALLVERGSRVALDAGGNRSSTVFAPADKYAVLFRKNAWNDYRIVAIGPRIAVFVNGTLFSELKDEQTGQRDLSGSLAFQLHAGPETRVEFRDIFLETLSADDPRLGEFAIQDSPSESENSDADVTAIKVGVLPLSDSGSPLNLDFETGTLSDWTATGDAFHDQPIEQDRISARWPSQISGKHGKRFIGGFELIQDAGTGTLTSATFKVTHRYGSFLLGGGSSQEIRVEIVKQATKKMPEQVIFVASGKNSEQMQRVFFDLQKWKNDRVFVRLVDESNGSWGHLNFDDFRLLDQLPKETGPAPVLRSTNNPILQHLVPNPVPDAPRESGKNVLPTLDTDPTQTTRATLEQMFVPTGFSVDTIAAEPQLHQPIAFTFDEKGRLWVVEGHSYPKKRPEGKGLDRILIFADNDADGTFETRKLFADGLNLVSGIQVGFGGVWVGAAPELLFIPDRNRDDVPDGPPEVLLEGFGYSDTHETLNSFRWGPDGWLYGNQGVFNTSEIGKPRPRGEASPVGKASDPPQERTTMQAGVWRYHPTRHTFEVFAHGGSNQWGLDYDQFGQLFMTHCRSYHGRGSTTHVIQGAHYWNQVNGRYAPFLFNRPLAGMPWMKNFTLASARYGHGEGGAGKPGSKAVYGGHSHVGTMIYQGDNWPSRYRQHLFTHNLHGHQMNHQINVRQAGGYNTLHAGNDVLLCTDPRYVAVDLLYGPDGAVYSMDWYDPRHCHHPGVEQWDRGNGRIYRMKFDATYKPIAVDYSTAKIDALIAAQSHPNAWHARAARLALSERAFETSVPLHTVFPEAVAQLIDMATANPDPAFRLRGIWALHGIGAIDRNLATRLMLDESEYVRGWAVQLAVESLPPESLSAMLVPLADREASLWVRRYLASAIQRVPNELGWTLVETLAGQSENAMDRELPLLIWYGLAPLMEQDLPRAFALAESTPLVSMSDYILWYATKLSPEGRNAVAKRLVTAKSPERLRLLHLFAAGVTGMRGISPPGEWKAVANELYETQSTAVAAEQLGAVFSDPALYHRMRLILGDPTSKVQAKEHALAILQNDSSPKNLSLFLQSLDNASLALPAIGALKRYDDPVIAKALISQLPKWVGPRSDLAMEVLCSRVGWSGALLDAIESGELKKERLTAFYARQMANLGNTPLTERLAQQWGRLNQSSSERLAEIKKLVTAYQKAPLWAYDAEVGKARFKKLCANCHLPDDPSTRLAPRLQGTSSKGIDYLVENVMDPNAVIGKDFQARIILTEEGRVVTGLVLTETDSAITISTGTSTETVAKDEIEQMSVSENSFMPEGLLQPLTDREKLELLKYIMTDPLLR